jgi:molybdopterin converting factor small subunit
MRVTAKLHGTLRKYLPAGTAANAIVVDVRDGATVAEIIARLSIPVNHAKMFVSGEEHLEPSTVLHDGQEINVFPPLAGG